MLHMTSFITRCWGNNRDGQIRARSGVYRQISSGYELCAISPMADVMCWGWNPDNGKPVSFGPP
jgi:hypothetical protein